MQPAIQRPPLPPLRHGERLTQPEFHRRYEAHPDGTKFELIGGVVYLTSPMRNPHGELSAALGTAFGNYVAATPGAQLFSDVTTILSAQAEPQPDLVLRIRPSHGGRTRDDADQYVHNGPELVAQVADSTVPLDLGARRDDNQQAGVIEYLVVDVPRQRLHWFDFRAGGEIRERGGVMRSRVFPGLWIARAALLAADLPALLAVVQQGIASNPHAQFVERLERARRRIARSSRS